LAARDATAVGAHREAAAHYLLALRHRDLFAPAERAELVERCAIECHTIGNVETAVAMQNDAIALCDQGLMSNTSMGMDFAKAIDICQSATMVDKKWGVIDAKLTYPDGTGVPDPNAYSIRHHFGAKVSISWNVCVSASNR
jgi:hypothetical protein